MKQKVISQGCAFVKEQATKEKSEKSKDKCGEGNVSLDSSRYYYGIERIYGCMEEVKIGEEKMWEKNNIDGFNGMLRQWRGGGD